MKIAAVVIVYHPEDSAIANIKTYSDFVDKLYIFDNTETATSSFAEKITALSKVQFFHDGLNEGIAKRLNMAGELAIQDGFDWLLTMDQDTTFTNEAITAYLHCAAKFPGKDKVAVFGTRYGREFESSSHECQSEQVEDTITSGSLINLQAFSAIGRFDENLFIDLVDNEYCARAAMAGYATIRLKNIHIVHSIGAIVNRAAIKTLFLVKKERQVHSPIRCYYSYRNMLYLENKYRHTNPAFAFSLRPYVNGYIKRNIFYGRNTIRIFQFLLAAIRDFKQGNMGKFRQS